MPRSLARWQALIFCQLSGAWHRQARCRFDVLEHDRISRRKAPATHDGRRRGDVQRTKNRHRPAYAAHLIANIFLSLAQCLHDEILAESPDDRLQNASFGLQHAGSRTMPKDSRAAATTCRCRTLDPRVPILLKAPALLKRIEGVFASGRWHTVTPMPALYIPQSCLESAPASFRTPNMRLGHQGLSSPASGTRRTWKSLYCYHRVA